MTENTFDAIADIIKERRDAADEVKTGHIRFTTRFTAAGIARMLANYFEMAFDTFDRDRFLERCGL